MEVYVVYKSYSGFEDDDSNGADIIGVFKDYDDACKALKEEVKQDEEFFKENEVSFETFQVAKEYYITSNIGDIDFCITRLPVE